MLLPLFLIFSVGYSLIEEPRNKEVKLFTQPPTVRLTSENFYPKILNSTKPWIVVFYAEWCRYSVSFSRLKWPWIIRMFKKNTVEFGAIDEKEEVYQEFDVEGFPTIKIFPPYSRGEALTTKIDRNDFKALQKIMSVFFEDQSQKPQGSNEIGKLWNTERSESEIVLEEPIENDSKHLSPSVHKTASESNPYAMAFAVLLVVCMLFCRFIRYIQIFSR